MVEFKKRLEELSKSATTSKPLVLLILILVFGTIFRLLYFNAGQTVWWDASEYLLLAKHIALGTPAEGFVGHREVAMAYVWSIFYKTGLGEIGVRLFQLIISIITIFVVYWAGKEIYNKKVGLLASFFMAFFYLHVFYTSQLNLFMDTTFFFTLGMGLFWAGYMNKKKNFIYFAAAVIALGLIFYYSAGFAIISIILFLLISDQFKFLKRKEVWVSGIVGFAILIPYLIRNTIVYGYPLPLWKANLAYAATVQPGSWLVNWKDYLGLLPSELHWPLFLLFLIGLAACLNLFLTFDLVIKGKDEKYRNDLYILLWILIPILIYTWVSIGKGGFFIIPGYILIVFPAVLILCGKGALFAYDKLKCYNKIFAIGLVCFFIIAGLFVQFNQMAELNNSKINAFAEIKLAGLWIKENSKPGDIVISNSVPQNTYYSERETIFDFGSQEEFEAAIIKRHPKYLVISMYEAYTPWLRQMGTDNNGNNILFFPYSNSTLVINNEGKVIARNFPEVKKEGFSLKLVQNIGNAFIWEFFYP